MEQSSKRLMKTPLRTLRVVLAVLATACGSSPRESDTVRPTVDEPPQIQVMTSGGFAAAYDILGPRFEESTGIRLETAYGASSGGAPDSIPSRLSRGEPADVIILSRASLDNLTDADEVRPESRVDLVRSLIGMAVRTGEPRPDISSTDAFVETLLAAESIGYSASASGTYLSTVLFPRLGIWERIKDKSTRVSGERVATVVARGDIQIGFQQISEILPITGVDYVGPIPDDVQETTTFSAGITARALRPENARRLIDYLSSEDVAETIADTGLSPVVREQSPVP